MIRKFIFLLFVLTAPSAIHAECKGVWELNHLAAAGKPMTLLSDQSRAYPMEAEFFYSLSDVHKRIDRASGIYTRLLICNSDEPNAFAWREGTQNLTAITLGMIELLGPDYEAYAALIGHENAHLTQNHIAKKRLTSVGFDLLQILASVALEVAIQDSGGASGIGSDIAALGTVAFSASYSRNHENEADKVGLQYAVQAGFSPEGAIRLHEKLNASGGFLSTHPSSGVRTARLRLLIQEMGIGPQPNTPIMSAAVVKGNLDFGMVVTAKPRLGYYIGTQTGLEEPVAGMRVTLVYENGAKLTGTIRKVAHGYFSVVTEGLISDSIEGASISRQ